MALCYEIQEINLVKFDNEILNYEIFLTPLSPAPYMTYSQSALTCEIAAANIF